jgi:hypothetical protein
VHKTIVFVLALIALGTMEVRAEILPFKDVRKGMHGYGLTVFQGNKIERFDVEVIGVLENVGPGENLILAHVDSDVIKSSGVIAGMSGSPIYIDGKMIGALAYSWQFAKDSIAGITPIEQMIAIFEKKEGPKMTASEPKSISFAELASTDWSATFPKNQASTSGLLAGVSQLIGRIAERRNVTLQGVPAAQRRPAQDGSGGSWILILFVVILIINAIAGRLNRRRGFRGGRWGGPFGGWSSGVGPFGGGGFGGGGFGGGFGGFGGGRSGGGGGGAGW